MSRDDDQAIIDLLRSLAPRDVVIDTFLRGAQVEVRSEFVGQQVSQDFLDDALINTRLKSMLISILSLQSQRSESLEAELASAIARMPKY